MIFISWLLSDDIYMSGYNMIRFRHAHSLVVMGLSRNTDKICFECIYCKICRWITKGLYRQSRPYLLTWKSQWKDVQMTEKLWISYRVDFYFRVFFFENRISTIHRLSPFSFKNMVKSILFDYISLSLYIHLCRDVISI